MCFMKAHVCKLRLKGEGICHRLHSQRKAAAHGQRPVNIPQEKEAPVTADPFILQ